MTQRRKAVLLLISVCGGLLFLFCGLLLSTPEPTQRCAICGEVVRPPVAYSMMHYLLFGQTPAFHMACASTKFRDQAEARMRELAHQKMNEKPPDWAAHWPGDGDWDRQVERDIAAYEKTHPRMPIVSKAVQSMPGK